MTDDTVIIARPVPLMPELLRRMQPCPWPEVRGLTKALGSAMVCGWCNKVLQAGVAPISHGICKDCLSRQYDELAEIKERGVGPQQ